MLFGREKNPKQPTQLLLTLPLFQSLVTHVTDARVQKEYRRR